MSIPNTIPPIGNRHAMQTRSNLTKVDQQSFVNAKNKSLFQTKALKSSINFKTPIYYFNIRITPWDHLPAANQQAHHLVKNISWIRRGTLFSLKICNKRVQRNFVMLHHIFEYSSSISPARYFISIVYSLFFASAVLHTTPLSNHDALHLYLLS